MYTIKKKGSENIPEIVITDYINPDGYCPKIVFSVTYSDAGFHVHFDAYEKNPKRVINEHFGPVHLDSCLEWFINFDPENTHKYINFEVNSAGFINFSLRVDRNNDEKFTLKDAECLGIKTEILDDMWTLDYTVPFEFIKKYYPHYEFKTGAVLPSNVYKCGDETEFEHYGCWKMVDREKPDFHKPEYFGRMIIE
ncbi:MAG: carbohydrate-binding family 9-like protein [Clostridia bacterium]|nr:carbohydrate-binding family 9-like protein [Clostridia bacterium]